MGKGLCRVVDSVDKCGKLCRTEKMFHVERVLVVHGMGGEVAKQGVDCGGMLEGAGDVNGAGGSSLRSE